jgi:hypothetical protein
MVKNVVTLSQIHPDTKNATGTMAFAERAALQGFRIQ